MQLTVIPLKAKRQNGNFILFDEISKTLSENSITLQNGDVIVISSIYVARSQGRILDTKSVIDSENANQISKKFKMKPKMLSHNKLNHKKQMNVADVVLQSH